MKVGFVTLFGRSNVGKSTLLNVLVGTKLAITSPKPQTTRRHVQGVLHTDEAQIIFVDTPGIFTSSRDRLTRSLNASAQNALKDVHVILHVVDPTRPIGPEDKKIFSLMEHVRIPVVMVINKMD
ncbi:GTPase Era, partial [Candidatus Uhrbacteria bacterium]|nr:GTPase Era [Candidatus Uhrbacteria bacterium]